MAKGARKTGRDRSYRHSRDLTRSSQLHPVKKTILIVGEGQETEPNYFRGLKTEKVVKKRFDLTVKKGPGHSPVHVVENAIKVKEQYRSRGELFSEVWCVFDVEGQEKRESLEAAVRLAEENGIIPCLSNPCFEVWLLAHFLRSKKEYCHCDAVVVDLNKKWEKRAKQKYQKGDKQIYERVSGLTQTAIDNARKVREIDHKGKANTADCNSSMEVYRLVGKLIGDRLGG